MRKPIADRGVAGIDGAVPGFGMEVGLGEGEGVAGDELALVWGDVEGADSAIIVFGDLMQDDGLTLRRG
jgi:hypothetical protein